MTTLTPPPPVLAAPRLRRWLTRYWAWLDLRKARRLASAGLNVAEHRWQQDYDQWWTRTGWAEGAPPASQPDAARQWVAQHTPPTS